MLLKKQLSDHIFNMVLGLTVLYGLAANIVTAMIFGPIFRTWSYTLLLFIWIIFGFGGILLLKKHKFWSHVLAYHLIVVPFGPVLSGLLNMYSSSQVILAISMTAVITAIMLVLSSLFPRFFAKLHGVLLLALGLSLGVSFLGRYLGFPVSRLSIISVIIFSLYFGYDWYHAQHSEKSINNAIMVAIDFYLDIINIFLRLLEAMSSDDD